MEYEILAGAPWERTVDCLDGSGPFWSLASYDVGTVVMLILMYMILPFSCYIVVAHLSFMPPHPKFLMECWTTVMVRVHILAGCVELFCGSLMWFVPNPVPFTTCQAVASLFHSASAWGMLRVVFGAKVLVYPLYVTLIAIKFYLAINVLSHPDCYRRALALGTIHTAYAWFRFIYFVLMYFGVSLGAHYTMCMALSCMVVLPLMGPASVPLAGFCILIYGVRVFVFGSAETQAWATTEDSRDVFDALGCSSDILSAIDEDDSLPPRAQSDCIFDILDVDKRGALAVEEIGLMLLRFGLPDSYARDIESSLRGVNLDKEYFFAHFRPLWVYAYHSIRMHKVQQAMLEKRAALLEHEARELEAVE
mmetsp:Transcript_52500/g.139792  ORF Transcript_52500/g.139792 Transcript_52500/m.139792 type:complete len:364 (-) Transcript_52500:119-1210(-)